MSLADIYQEIIDDPENKSFIDKGWKPLYTADPEAKICIIGQAPGLKAQEAGIIFDDRSGDTLRQWMGVTSEQFYDPKLFAILPMDFFYDGKDERGADIPPRKGFAEKWHPKLLACMPNIQLFILTGSYATHYYLNLKTDVSLTSVVENYQSYLPRYFPIVHPSGRNQIWEYEHPWFKEQVVPALKQRVAQVLAE